MDECLQILRALSGGEPVSFEVEFFSFRDALIVLAPSPPIPLVVGGRSQAAVRRAASLGDGWLGILVSPRRFASVVEQVSQQGTDAGRDPGSFEHALNVWRGFGTIRETARAPLAAGCRPSTRCHSSVKAGCSAFNVIPCASDDEMAVTAVGELRRLLTHAR